MLVKKSGRLSPKLLPLVLLSAAVVVLQLPVRRQRLVGKPSMAVNGPSCSGCSMGW